MNEEKLLTDEEVLAEAELYASPDVMKAIRKYYEQTGQMPGVVLSDLKLEKIVVVAYRRLIKP